MVCRSRQALMQGLRPTPTSQSTRRFCVRSCIYCDIWKLATLLSSRKSLSQRYNWIISTPGSSSTTGDRAEPDSPRLQETFDWEPTERMIEAQFQTQRSVLASIMSICTVDGVEECEGLRMAHTRCLRSVAELLYQEKVLEETILRSAQASSSSSSSSWPSSSSSFSSPSLSRRSSAQRMTNRDCSSVNNNNNNNNNSSYHFSERRPSLVEIA